MPHGVSIARAKRLAQRAGGTRTVLARANEHGRVHAQITLDVKEMRLKTGQDHKLLLALFEVGSTKEGADPRPLIIEGNRAFAFFLNIRIHEGQQTALLRIDLVAEGHEGEWVEIAYERVRKAGHLVAFATIVCTAGVMCCLLASWGDPHARKGHYEGKTLQEIQQDLDAEVDWYAMEISIAPEVSMAEGTTKCALRVENLEANHCDQRIRVWETGHEDDVLFESGAIAPGEYLQTIELAHPLSLGSHTLTVEFQGYERQPTLVSDEGIPLGHNSFGASCAAEVEVEVVATT